MDRQQRVRTERKEGVALEHVHLEIDFDWEHFENVRVDLAASRITLPDGLEGRHGVYYIRSGVNGADIFETDATYVGRSVDNMENRVVEAVRDPGKKFKENLERDGGWVQVDVATNVRINGQAITDEWLDDPRIIEAVESAGVVYALGGLNNQNKR